MQKNASLIAWEPNSASDVCRLCGWKWGLIRHRRHHCRKCGKLVCGRCSRGRSKFLDYPDKAVRVCDKCFMEITAPPAAASPTQTSRKKIPELAVTNKVMFASTKAPQVQPVADKETYDIGTEKANDSGDDDANEEDSGDEPSGAGHALQLEEMGLHHTSSHDLYGPSTVDSAATHNTQVTTETDLDDQFDLNVQEGVSSTKQVGLDAKKIKLTLSRFGNMNFTDDESSGPNSTNNANSTQDAKAFDFSPTSPLVPEEKTEDSVAPVSEKAEDTAAEEVQRKSDGSTESAEGTVESQAATYSATTADVNTSVEKPAPKHRLVVRKASVVVAAAAAERADADTAGAAPAPKLAGHLTPMPSGGTVRRLSTLSTRTPFNSTATPSPAAAAAVAGGSGEAPSAGGADAGDADAPAVDSNSATTDVNAALAEEGATETKAVPSVDSGASTPVLSVRPSLAAGLPESAECASTDVVSEKASAEAEVPVQELLAGAATQLSTQLAAELEQSAVDASETANGADEGVADEANTDGAVEAEEGVTKDRTESTATADSAQNDNGANSKGNKKGGKKNRGRK